MTFQFTPVGNIDYPKACGLGQGEGCCAFLSVAAGWVCGRTMPGVYETVLARLEAGTMNAKYDPGDTPFPDCQPGEEGA